MFIDKGPWEPGPGFRLLPEEERPVTILKSFENWNPFPDDDTGKDKYSSVSFKL